MTTSEYLFYRDGLKTATIFVINITELIFYFIETTLWFNKYKVYLKKTDLFFNFIADDVLNILYNIGKKIFYFLTGGRKKV